MGIGKTDAVDYSAVKRYSDHNQVDAKQALKDMTAFRKDGVKPENVAGGKFSPQAWGNAFLGNNYACSGSSGSCSGSSGFFDFKPTGDREADRKALGLSKEEMQARYGA